MKSLFLLFGYTWSAFAVPLPENHRIFPPFISGDSFRTYADYAFDDHDMTLDPKKVTRGSVIFVQARHLKTFFHEIHPQISDPYILISHNSDDDVPGHFREYLDDDKLSAWFGENWDGYVHPKMHSIPMGMATFEWSNGKGDVMRKIIDAAPVKEHLVHMSFTIQTNHTERSEVNRLFSKEPFVFHTNRKGFEKYLLEVAASKFELAPRGFAWDTFRLWECLYLGTIPIVKTSPLDSLYEDLPVLIVEDWKDVTEEFLNKKYLEMSQRQYNMEKTTIDYWLNIIKNSFVSSAYILPMSQDTQEKEPITSTWLFDTQP